MKTAIITGICGQDGAYLAAHLVELGYRVYGFARRNASMAGLSFLGISRSVDIRHVDITDPFHVAEVIAEIRPDEIYNLAAQSHVGLSFKNPMATCAINYGGYLNVLLAARKHVPECRVYQAGTSEMFGYASEHAASESTPFMPMSPYAISKVAAHWAGVNARYESDQFVANGILFNHESPIRGSDFLTRKVTQFVAQYSREGEGVLPLGNLDSVRDWGHAGDYVKAMHKMLQFESPQDFVVATGYNLSVRKFVVMAFQAIGKDIKFEGQGVEEVGLVDGRETVVVSKDFYRPNDLNYLKGNPMKAMQLLGWKPTIGITQLVDEMVTADIDRL